MNMLDFFWVKRPSKLIYQLLNREYVVMDFCAFIELFRFCRRDLFACASFNADAGNIKSYIENYVRSMAGSHLHTKDSI